VFPAGIFEDIELPPQQVALFVLARRAQQKLSPQQSEDSVADAGSNDKSTDVARASPQQLAGMPVMVGDVLPRYGPDIHTHLPPKPPTATPTPPVLLLNLNDPPPGKPEGSCSRSSTAALVVVMTAAAMGGVVVVTVTIAAAMVVGKGQTSWQKGPSPATTSAAGVTRHPRAGDHKTPAQFPPIQYIEVQVARGR
jgi:hypothetical protein